MNQIKWDSLTQSQLIDNFSGIKGQSRIKYLEDAVDEPTIPTLKQLARRFSNSCAVTLIGAHLASLHQLGDSKTTKEAFTDTATLILTEYSYLNIQELNYFFRQCKLGTYGKMIWGDRLQYQDLLIGLKSFIKDRGNAVYKKSVLKNKSESERGYLKFGYDQFCKQKERAHQDIKAFRKIYPKLPTDKSELEYWKEWKINRSLDSILCKYNQEYRE